MTASDNDNDAGPTPRAREALAEGIKAERRMKEAYRRIKKDYMTNPTHVNEKAYEGAKLRLANVQQARKWFERINKVKGTDGPTDVMGRPWCKNDEEFGQIFPSPENCSYCGKPFDGPECVAHVDDYHRLTPLCGECYANPVAAKATASDPENPTSWWNQELANPH
jgi:hypothetical protein